MKNIISFAATFAILLNSFIAPISALAQEVTPSPTPTPEVSETTIVEPTATPTLSEWTFENVELNKEYQSNGVTLIFTKLPDNQSNIKIEEITLNENQIKDSGALSDKAYDITSNMEDGTFAYNLSLPLPESAKGKSIEVKYSEDGQDFISSEDVSTTESDVLVSDLNHFTIFVVVLEPNWTAPGGGGVFSAYIGPPTYDYLSPGNTAIYDGREAGIIKAGISIDTEGHYWDEGLFGFKPEMTINTFAGGPITYDTINQEGTNPVWMTIEIDTGVADDRTDNTTYQFVPTSNPAGWHTVNAGAGLWQQWADNSGSTTGPLMTLEQIASVHDGLSVVRAYLRLGMGDSYHGSGSGTIAWIDKLTISSKIYDFVVLSAPKLIAPLDNDYVDGVSLTNSWSNVPAAVKYVYESYNDAERNSLRWRQEVPAPQTFKTATNVADAVFWWRVQAVDAAGNSSDWSSLWKVTVDNTPPSAPELLGNPIIYMKPGDVVRSWKASSSNDVVEYIYKSFASEAAAQTPNTSSGWSPDPTKAVPGQPTYSRKDPTGDYERTFWWRVAAVDAAGNKTWSEDIYKVIVDKTSPTITVDSFVTNDKTPKLSGTVNDYTATVSIDINGNSYTAINNGDGTWDLIDGIITIPLADGKYDVIASATDTAGNIGVDLTDNELVIDTVAPTARYMHYVNEVLTTNPIVYVNDINKLSFTAEYNDQTPSSQLLKDSYVIFDAQKDGSFKFSQNGAKSYCSWRREPNLVSLSGETYSLTDKEAFANCVGTLADGGYYMTHQVYDHAIRQDIPSITQFRDVLGLHFVIDTVKPTGTWTFPTNNSTVSGTITLNFTATDDASGVASKSYSYSDDSGTTFIPIAGNSWDTTTLPLGSYTLRATVTDNAGNTADFDETVNVAAVISNESAVGNGTTTALITWTTDRPTTSRVVFDTVSHPTLGSEPNYGYANSTVEDTTKTTSHLVTITGLTPNTTYYYRVISHGSPVTVSGDNYFRTLSVAGAPSPSGTSGTSVLGANTNTVSKLWDKLSYAFKPETENEENLENDEIVKKVEKPATTSAPSPDVLGAETESVSWWHWLLFLLIIPFYFGVKYLFKKE